jgi:hypothetical protein
MHKSYEFLSLRVLQSVRPQYHLLDNLVRSVPFRLEYPLSNIEYVRFHDPDNLPRRTNAGFVSDTPITFQTKEISKGMANAVLPTSFGRQMRNIKKISSRSRARNAQTSSIISSFSCSVSVRPRMCGQCC